MRFDDRRELSIQAETAADVYVGLRGQNISCRYMLVYDQDGKMVSGALREGMELRMRAWQYVQSTDYLHLTYKIICDLAYQISLLPDK
jgi:hypothetical protein